MTNYWCSEDLESSDKLGSEFSFFQNQMVQNYVLDLATFIVGRKRAPWALRLIDRIGPRKGTQFQKFGSQIRKIADTKHQELPGACLFTVSPLPPRDCCDLASCMLHDGQVGYNIMPRAYPERK